MSFLPPRSASVLQQLLERADDFDRAGKKDSALSAASEAFAVLQERNDLGFVLSAKVAQAFLVRSQQAKNITGKRRT